MNNNETIRLLIINDTPSEAERLISMLNNAGLSVRAQYVESEEALVKLLQDQAWDLLISQDNASKLPPQSTIQQIRRLSKDVSVILQTDDEGSQPVVEGLKIGAIDVVRLDEDQHLLLIIARELSNREHRRQRRIADRKLKEAERRSQALLDSSKDAIAFVQDGLYLYANQSFADLFHYADKDDIECMPVIDMVAEDDQSKVKNFLKEFALKGETEDLSELSFRGLDTSGNAQPIALKVSNAHFDEEPCIQFYVPATMHAENKQLASALQDMKDRDPTSGLYNRKYLINMLDLAIDKATNNQQEGALIHIAFNNFEESVQNSVGMAAIDTVVKQIAGVLQACVPETNLVSRFADDAYQVLVNQCTADSALALASTIAKQLQGMIIDVNQKTLQLRPYMGIALINETNDSTQAVIDEALEACVEANQIPAPELPVKLYEPPLIDGKISEKDIARAVKGALESNRFRLMFQPIISLRGSEEEFYEVLVRMIDDDGNEVFPVKFFEAAERNGIATKIDRWVILEAVKVLAEHRANGNNTRLLINLGRHSMCDDSLPGWISVVFKAANLNPDTVIFQCKEVDISNHLNAAKTFFDAITAMNSRTGISNFGCTLSPFNTLKHVNGAYIKVDGSFTQDIQNSNEGADALKELLSQLHQDNKVTIVPFVEQASVLSTLWQAGAHYIQGHYLQGPAADMSYEFSSEG